MNYLSAINCIRNETGYDGLVDVDATKPPTEEEKTSLSLLLNRKLVHDFREKVSKAVQYYFDKKEFDLRIGLPVGALQIVYKELFGCLLDYEVLGFESLASFCLCIDGFGFQICRINENFILLPALKSWYLPEAEPDFPHPPVLEELEYPKDVVDFDYVLQELDHRDYIKQGEVIKIVIMNYESPLKFYFLPEPFFWTFLQFRKGLSDFYRNNRELTMPREFIRPGQLCAVGYLTLRFICIYDRGLIIDIFNETTVTVLLIDIGRKMLAPMNIVKFLHKQFASFPVHSLPGMLAGLVPRTAALSETANTKMMIHFKEPYLEAEIYNADYEEPMFSIIAYPRYSRRSLNRQLIDSRDYRFEPLFPTGKLIRGLDEVQSKPEFDKYDEPGAEHPKSEREPLLNLDSDGDIYVDDPDPEGTEVPQLPTRSQRDPWTPLPEAKPRIRPSPSIIRPRPIVDANKSSLALGPVSAPPKMESDARQSDSESSNSEDLKPIHLPLRAEALVLKRKPNENEIVETGIKPRPLAQSVLWQLRLRVLFPPNSTLSRRQFFLPTIKQNEITPGEMIRVRLPEIPSVNSSTDSDEFEDPSRSNEDKKDEKILKRAPGENKGKKGTEQKPEEAEDRQIIHPEENNLNVDRDKIFPPERCTFFDVPKARADVSSDSTESDLEPEKNTKGGIDDLEKLQEEMELNRLTISLLATNQIVRDVARQRPQRAYPMAKKWAKFALETNDSSLPDGALFNPFDKLREDLDEKLASEYQLLAEMVPGFIYDEYAALAAATPLGNPSIKINPRHDWQSFLYPEYTYDDTKNEEEMEASPVVKKFRATWEMITIEATPSIKKRRYRFVAHKMDMLVSRDELKLLCVFPQLEIEKRIKNCRRTVVYWPVNTPEELDEFHNFLRFFNEFVTLHRHVDRFEREAKKKLLFPRATR